MSDVDNAAYQDTDDAEAVTVLAAIRHCANSWESGARLVGNVRAGDISRVCTIAINALAQGAWMPIETAPRDGSRILATGGGIGGSTIEIVTYNERVGAWDAPNDTLDDRDDEPDGYNRPSLWQPLPALSLPSTKRGGPRCTCARADANLSQAIPHAPGCPMGEC